MDEAARTVVVETARAHARDYYLSALLAPRKVRDDLLVLAAFEGELQRIPESVSEPLLVEIRLQWWRDWIASFTPEARTGNLVADALADVAVRRGLDRADLLASVDARVPAEELETQLPIPGARRRLASLDAAAMARAATVLGARPDAQQSATIAVAGLAYSLARRAVTTRSGLGKMDTPNSGLVLNLKSELQMARRNLGDLQEHLRRWPKPLRLAVLPVALVEPYLRACEKGRVDGAAPPIRADDAMVPLIRVWRLWRFASTGHL